MKRYLIFLLSLIFLSGFAAVALPKDISKSGCFFTKSLHYDAHGMAYWYSKRQNGIERLVQVPYKKLPCSHCHISSCDECHRVKKDRDLIYSAEKARDMKNCLKCHLREKLMLGLIKKANVPDVHFSRGMRCVDCHKAVDIHGDGRRYVSMREPGAVKAKCSNCHKEIPKKPSHTIHKNKLDCTACHVQQIISCANCHMDTLIKKKKKIAIPLSGWSFLVNYRGKVVSGDIQTFVIGENKTFLVIAPYFSHYITEKGKKCSECHGTKIVKEIQKNNCLTITWIENGKLKNMKGVIPIVEGVEYKNAFMNYKNGKWIPIKNPQKPLVQFAVFGEPLTKEQLKKLSTKLK